MRFSRWLAAHAAFFAVALACGTLQGCVDGRVDPVLAGAAVDAAGQIACPLLGVVVKQKLAAVVCEDVVDAVKDVLEATEANVTEAPDGQPPRFKPLADNGRVIGLVRADLSTQVTRELAARREDMTRGIAR